VIRARGFRSSRASGWVDTLDAEAYTRGSQSASQTLVRGRTPCHAWITSDLRSHFLPPRAVWPGYGVGRPGDILVVDENVGVVRHYSASGSDLGLFASGLNAPAWITTDRSGNVYVTEYQGKKIDKFSPTGQVLLTITTLYLPGGVAIGSDARFM